MEIAVAALVFAQVAKSSQVLVKASKSFIGNPVPFIKQARNKAPNSNLLLSWGKQWSRFQRASKTDFPKIRVQNRRLKFLNQRFTCKQPCNSCSEVLIQTRLLFFYVLQANWWDVMSWTNKSPSGKRSTYRIWYLSTSKATATPHENAQYKWSLQNRNQTAPHLSSEHIITTQASMAQHQRERMITLVVAITPV